MSEYRAKSPVVFIVFNRPDHTRRVASLIAAAKPARLFIIADGPRDNVTGDADKCREVRSIVEKIDWDCEVSFDYAGSNLGCRKRIGGGLDRVFAETEGAIILEDDCLPSLCFFRYCDELLEKYRDEPRVMMVSGTNVLGESPADCDYLFTMHGRCWGWATWKRAWSTYDVDLGSWARRRLEAPFRHLPFHRKEIEVFQRTLDNLRDENPQNWKHDAWDYQWDYNRYIRDGFAITPRVNLVANIGFGEGATHTHDASDVLAGIPAGNLDFPLKHPETIELSLEYEERYSRKIIRKRFPVRVRKFFTRAKRFIGRLRAS